jgi:hypothetical protein
MTDSPGDSSNDTPIIVPAIDIAANALVVITLFLSITLVESIVSQVDRMELNDLQYMISYLSLDKLNMLDIRLKL